MYTRGLGILKISAVLFYEAAAHNTLSYTHTSSRINVYITRVLLYEINYYYYNIYMITVFITCLQSKARNSMYLHIFLKQFKN